MLEFTVRNKIDLYAKRIPTRSYKIVLHTAYISFRLTFDQKEPEDVAELEELRSWDHELHFTDIQDHVKLYYTLSKLAYISNKLE